MDANYEMGVHKQNVSDKMASHNWNLFDVKCALNIGLQIILWKRHFYNL